MSYSFHFFNGIPVFLKFVVKIANHYWLQVDDMNNAGKEYTEPGGYVPLHSHWTWWPDFILHLNMYLFTYIHSGAPKIAKLVYNSNNWDLW